MILIRIATLVVVFAITVPWFPPVAAAPQSPGAPAEVRLPVKRVVLYKSGIGYFEHLGRVRGSQDVTIEFTSSQLDDVLKSLTALDLDGGRVASVSYNSDAGLTRRLSGLRLPLGPSATRSQLLMALKGARIAVRGGTTTLSGRLLSVERQERRSDGVSTAVDMLSLVSDAGDIQTVALEAGITVRIVDADLNEEVAKYLAVIGSSRDEDVRRLTLSTAGQGDRDLFVSYVSEVPVWKSTYRLVLGEGTAAPLLQGWAIVDNTIGEDWNGVELSLVAGAPQAFIQNISQPYYVQRPVVPLPERVLSAPQTHAGTLSTSGNAGISGRVTDSSNGVIPGATVRVLRDGQVVASGVSGGDGQYRFPNLAPGAYDVLVELSGFQSLRARNIQVMAGRDTTLTHTLQVGAMSESISVDRASAINGLPSGRAGRGGGAVGGVVGGIPAPVPAPPPAAPRSLEERVQAAQDAMQAAATGADLGDLFEYKLNTPVTILKNQSAMVPIVNGGVGAEKVSIWAAEAGTTRPLRAIWLTNSTGQTLDGGSMSIVEGQAFAGEGLIEPLKAGERRLVSYATDLAMQVTSTGDVSPSRITKVTLSRGVLVQQREDRQSRVYAARNEDAQPRVLVIEHPVRDGWILSGNTKAEETTASAHRFRVTVAPRTTATLTVDEVRPGQTQYSIGSVNDEQVRLWVSGESITSEVAAQLREVIRRRTAINELSQQINVRESELATIDRDQARVRENMKALKGSAEERQLVQRYVRQLDEQETRLEALRSEIRDLTTRRNTAQAELGRYIEGLSPPGVTARREAGRGERHEWSSRPARTVRVAPGR
ncbi:MAG: carboxypeptidase regulatory-like domain-containing protein [Acidobacteria bacterium]|nr:carboxypeptidase regulatory-like domain-containing protein [Acidobacteriota bacterium]